MLSTWDWLDSYAPAVTLFHGRQRPSRPSRPESTATNMEQSQGEILGVWQLLRGWIFLEIRNQINSTASRWKSQYTYGLNICLRTKKIYICIPTNHRYTFLKFVHPGRGNHLSEVPQWFWRSKFQAVTVFGGRAWNKTTDNNSFFSYLKPRKLTWNLKMSPWKRRFLLKTIIFRFHVSFRGCKPPQKKSGRVRFCVFFCDDLC